ncbi:hypothetical protein OROHE_020497 [Orobanche hederae]
MVEPKTFNFQLVNGRLSAEQREHFYMEMKHVVVNVEVLDGDVYDCQGGGVFISPEGHVLTLLHMLLDAQGKVVKKLRVKTNKGETYQASIKSFDETLGLALLNLSGPRLIKTRFPFARICTDELKIGEEIYPIGHPGYLDFSFPIGHISFPCREYDEVCNSLNTKLVILDSLERKAKSKLDVSAQYICYVDHLSCLHGLSKSVCFVMVNNVHGDGREGASGMPFFNNRGEIIGMYYFLAHDQCFGIHAKTLYSFAIDKKHRSGLKDHTSTSKSDA